MYNEKALDKLEETTYRELEKLNERVEKGELTPQILSVEKDLICLLKDIPEVKKKHSMEPVMESGNYDRYHDPRYYDITAYDAYPSEYSERRGRNPMTGRYVSRDDWRMSSYPMSGSNNAQPSVEESLRHIMDRLEMLEKK